MRKELDEYKEMFHGEINEIWSIKTMDSTLYKYIAIPPDKKMKKNYIIVEVFNDPDKNSIVYGGYPGYPE